MASFGRKGGARRSDRKRLASAANARQGWTGAAGERRRAAIQARVAQRKGMQ
jgi:hypothetical protein